jgi:hypothetical protein
MAQLADCVGQSLVAEGPKICFVEVPLLPFGDPFLALLFIRSTGPGPFLFLTTTRLQDCL